MTFHRGYICKASLLKIKKVKINSWMVLMNFLPVWVLVCLFRSNVSLNPFPQKVQRYLLVSLWHFMCLLRRRCKVKALPQTLQANLLGSVSLLNGGSFSTSFFSGTSATIGFLIPWPPFINSRGASVGIPN